MNLAFLPNYGAVCEYLGQVLAVRLLLEDLFTLKNAKMLLEVSLVYGKIGNAYKFVIRKRKSVKKCREKL